MERAFAFNIAGDSSFLNDSPRAGFAIDFCQHVVYVVAVVFCLASLRKLRRYCWSRAKRNYNSRRSELRFHRGNLLQGHPLLRLWQLARQKPLPHWTMSFGMEAQRRWPPRRDHDDSLCARTLDLIQVKKELYQRTAGEGLAKSALGQNRTFSGQVPLPLYPLKWTSIDRVEKSVTCHRQRRGTRA